MKQKEFRPTSGTSLPKLWVNAREKGQLIQGQMAKQKQKPLSKTWLRKA